MFEQFSVILRQMVKYVDDSAARLSRTKRFLVVNARHALVTTFFLNLNRYGGGNCSGDKTITRIPTIAAVYFVKLSAFYGD